MRDSSDFELHKTELPPSEPPRQPRSPLPWIIIAGVVIATLGLGWYFFAGRQTTEPAETTATVDTAAPPAPDRPLGGDAEPVELPPLDQTDALVRRLVRELSSHPRAVAWLATDNLIRRFTVAVENIANGRVPTQALGPLRPTGRFAVIETDTVLRIDPRSYDRYNALAAAVDSVDPGGAARLYAILKPRIEEAYAELGRDVPFDRTLERAIVVLLRAPALEGSVSLEPKGGVFGYENPAVEGLSAAQKQLVRMGPGNVRIMQSTLRAIGLALGISAERLPG